MTELFESMDEVEAELKKLSEDVKVMLAEASEKAKTDKTDKTDNDEKRGKEEKLPSIKESGLMRPLTRMRPDIESAKEAEANPEMQKIEDRLNDIFNLL